MSAQQPYLTIRVLTFTVRFLLDDEDMYKRAGGGGYEAYGIGPDGAIVVVRPDGYVGTVAPLQDLPYLDSYFASFLVSAP